VRCNRSLKLGLGVFCANFASRRGEWKPCRSAWCGKCYVPMKWDKYPVKVLKTEEGLPIIGCLQDKHNYRKVRNSDFLMCAFQCDLCHFRNIQKRDFGREDQVEVFLLTTSSPANLDAFWARKSSTVSHNGTTMRNIVRIGQERFGVTGSSVFKAQGPHPLEDSFGMLKSCMLLDNSLNQGRNETNVQFETIRKTRSAVSNYDCTTREDLELHCLAGYKRGEIQSFTGTTVYREWFNISLIGCHAIMGDDKLPDQAMPIEVIPEVQATLERDLFNSQTSEHMIRVCVHAVFIICGFCTGLRGEKLQMTSMDAMEKHYKKTNLWKAHLKMCSWPCVAE
jgi:hypothetical protein